MSEEKNMGFIPSENNNINQNTQNLPLDEPVQDNINNDEEINAISQPVVEDPRHEEFSQQPIITEERPAIDTVPNQPMVAQTPTPPKVVSQTSSQYYGGVAYTTNVDGESKSGYEWNGNQSAMSEIKHKTKNTGSKGFKIFIGTILSVFTVSVVALSAMVTSYVLSTEDRIDGVVSEKQASSEAQSSISQSSSSQVNSSTSNFVVYHPSEFEGEHLTIPQIAAKCSPSSVGIVSQVEVSYSYPFGFGSSKGLSEASGSGFIYSSDGYIITNHHVIEDANEVTVILHDGKEYKAEIIGSDSLSDIAVLKITVDEGTTLTPMEIGNSDELVVGESVVAIGCPAGIEFIGTVTDGIISAINRNVEITDNYGTTNKTMTLIQTNATINQGNSGGPLINSRGQVIGINTLKLNSSSYEGIGFSIPMNGAMPVIKQLIEHGKVIERTQDDFAYGKGVIGITGSAISEDEAEYYNIPLGVLVVQIDKNSSAAKAGLRRGDIITHYNGKEVTSVVEINEAKGTGRAGEQVTVTVYRDSEYAGGEGQTIDITFTLDSQQ